MGAEDSISTTKKIGQTTDGLIYALATLAGAALGVLDFI